MIRQLTKISIAVVTVLLAFTSNAEIHKSAAQSKGYAVAISVDKTSVKAGDDLQITITATNTSGTALSNFEIRVPYNRTINDASYVSENPAFSRYLDTKDYPAGYNSRSWLINTFDPGETRTYTLKYKVSADPKTPNGLVSTVSLPAGWQDPRGLAAGTSLTLQTMRADVYVNNVYSSSFETALPKLAALDNPVSQVKLNDVYFFTGSKTTNLKNITTENLKAFAGFTLETQDVLVEWTVPVDFSAAGVVDKLKAFDTYFKPSWGKLDITAEQIPFLNKPHKVTFKNVNLVMEPKIKTKAAISSLTEGKGTWQQAANAVIVTSETLQSLAVVPNIETEKGVIETDSNRVTIKGKVADPKALVTYNIDNSGVREVVGIDLVTGAFSIDISDADKVKQVEISSKYKNNETDSKIVMVKYKVASETTAAPTQAATPRNSSILLNPITLALLLAALAVMSVIGGYIYYLYNRKRKVKKAESAADFKDITLANRRVPDAKNEPFVPPLTPAVSPDSPKIDLKALKDEYMIKDPQTSTIPKTKSEARVDTAPDKTPKEGDPDTKSFLSSD
jgi:hypothetical protein